MKCFKNIILLFTLVIATGCEKVIFSGEGEILEITQSYDEFTQLSFYDIFEIELLSDSIFSVELITNERYVDQIRMVLDSGNLKFYDDNIVKWMADYPWPKVRITFPELRNSVLLESPVSLKTPDTLKVNQLNITSIGKTGEISLTINVSNFQIVTGSDNSGHYTVSGKAENARIWPRGSCFINAGDLVTENCNVYNNSIGNCTVNVRKSLKARLNTMGNVYYKGDPEEVTLVEESGTGKLIRLPE